MRCLALAQAWQDVGGHSTFVMATESANLESRLKSEGTDVIHLSSQPGTGDDSTESSGLARRMSAQWVVVDGYHFGAEYQQIIKDSGLRLLLIDDNGHADHYYADIILNQNIHAHKGLYVNRQPSTHLLLGTKYVLLRREFLKWRGWKRDFPQIARKILVTLGGADTSNVTLKVLQAIQKIDIPDLEVKIIVGPSNPHLQELQSVVFHPPLAISILQNVADISDLMAWSDVAVSGAGSTCWELAFMGLPSLILILAQNQQAIAQEMANEGAAVNCGWYHQFSRDQFLHHLQDLITNKANRLRMTHREKPLVDGLGPERILGQMVAMG